MKVYQFNPDNGIYAGELFEESEQLKYVEGVTTIAPPAYGPGQVAVFDPHQQAWDTMPTSLFRRNEPHGH
jgi:hypothetical protein